jgi:hypothetical protein
MDNKCTKNISTQRMKLNPSRQGADLLYFMNILIIFDLDFYKKYGLEKGKLELACDLREKS